MDLGGDQGTFCYSGYPRVTSSLLAKSNINFVIKIMEARCGKCGILNNGTKMNTHPWFAAIRESLTDDITYTDLGDEYHTGTLVSKQWVVTAASIFVNDPIATDNYRVLVGAKALENHYHDRWDPIIEIKRHPKYNSIPNSEYDIAMVKLKHKILDPVPHPSDVDYDTIRPICLPDYEADIPISRHSYLYGREVYYSKRLTTEKATITSHGDCKNALIDRGVEPREYVHTYLLLSIMKIVINFLDYIFREIGLSCYVMIDQ